MDLYPRRKVKLSGFTLIEVIFAIVILSGSLIVLLGLQSSAIDKALRDRNQLDAMLLARNILAALEIQEDIIDNSVQGSALQLIKDFNAVPAEDYEELERFSDFQADLQIEDWQTPAELAEQISDAGPLMKKLYLKIFWSDLPDDQIEIVYFVPAKK